jgi:hypothetical protein
MKKLLAAALVVALAACNDTRFMQVGVEPSANGGIPALQQADDSLRLYASEWQHGLFSGVDPAIPGSDEAPDRYQWSSSSPAVAEMRPSGWMITHATGQVVITVKGPGSSYAQTVSVCSRDTRLVIDPRDPVIRLNDTIIVTFSLRQPGGAECGTLDFGPFAPQTVQALEPIFSMPHHWRSIRLGAYWYDSYLRFAQRTLRDSILVTVR